MEQNPQYLYYKDNEQKIFNTTITVSYYHISNKIVEKCDNMQIYDNMWRFNCCIKYFLDNENATKLLTCMLFNELQLMILNMVAGGINY